MNRDQPDEVSQAIAKSLVDGLKGLGLVLVPESLAKAAYELSDLLEERAGPDAERFVVDAEVAQSIDRLVSQVAIARAREPGEQAT